MESGAQRLDFTHLSELTFEAADDKRFPCLPLAWQALTAPEGTTAVLNAANEVAVEAFLHKQLRFDQIYHVVSEVLEHVTCSAAAKTLGDLFDLDMQARSGALSLIHRIGPL